MTIPDREALSPAERALAAALARALVAEIRAASQPAEVTRDLPAGTAEASR